MWRICSACGNATPLDDQVVASGQRCLCVACHAAGTGTTLRISRELYRELALILAEVG